MEKNGKRRSSRKKNRRKWRKRKKRIGRFIRDALGPKELN
jgi:hypothetical protein